jgi:UPF0755 protein
MKSFRKITLLITSVFILLLFALLALQTTSNEDTKSVIISQNWTEAEFDNYAESELGIKLPLGIYRWATLLGFKIQNVKFVIEPHTSTWRFLWALRKNRNQTVNLVIPPGIYEVEMAKIIERNLLYSREEVLAYFKKSQIWNEWGFQRESWPSWIIPNTYNFSMNANLNEVFIRLREEQSVFWNEDRLNKLKNQKLNINEAVTIASIVQKESLKTQEYETLAGVYINRLRINMPLGADPTLVFIRGKGGRVYNKDMKIESPYNTYKYKGLPPGPICIPSTVAIDAVLNYTKHPYLYFCANSDLSGFHVFETNYENHLKNARKFQHVLDKQKKL